MMIRQFCSLFFFILSIAYSYAQQGLVITEIMANPPKSGDLAAEYIEIYNNSATMVSLRNVRLRIATTTIPLPDQFLAPKQYLMLTATANIGLLEHHGNVMGLPSWRALNNQGADIALLDADQNTLDHVVYAIAWYGSTLKRAGGWSLERINPNISCNNQSTWIASVAAQGGTPGQQNSVWNEAFSPDLSLRLIDVQDNRIRLKLDDSVETLSIRDKSQFRLEPGAISASDYLIRNDTIAIYFDRSLSADVPYELYLANVAYCSTVYNISIPLLFSSENKYNDIVINEILFNPKAGSVDFVELYNRSSKTINIQGWLLGNRRIVDQFALIAPQEYRVLTTDAKAVFESYPNALLENFIVMPSLPAYANSRGTVLLFDDRNRVVDSVYYESGMHQPFLTDVKGISLERQDAEIDGNASGNFVSASTLSGGATPGYVNSNQIEKKVAKNSLQLLTKTFSPDGDGFEDLLVFRYAFQESNMMLSLTIYDSNGRLVNRLIRNKSAGYTGEIPWNGVDENGRNCAGGIYIYHAEIISSKGLYQTFKGSFVLVEALKKY